MISIIENFSYPKSPSIVLFGFLAVLSFSTLILILSPCSLNCLSNSLMNLVSSVDSPENDSKIDFGFFVGLTDDAFLIGLLSDDFAATNVAEITKAV